MNAETERTDGLGNERLAMFVVDPDASTPPFRQLHDLVVAGIRDGRLRPGQRLPTTRALATHLGLAVNTVAGAYRSLEQAGIVEGRGRAGTFVRLGTDPVEHEAQRLALNAAAGLRRLGIGRERALELLGSAYDASREG